MLNFLISTLIFWKTKKWRARFPCDVRGFVFSCQLSVLRFLSMSKLVLISKWYPLSIVCFCSRDIFGCHNLKRIKYLTRLRLGLSHLYEHKFKINFQDTLHPLCTCSCDVENTCHFLLHCSNSLTERNTLLKKISNIDSNILNQADATITKTLLFGNSR